MKSLVLAVLIGGAASLSAQTPTPSDPGKVFHLLPEFSEQSPRFKLQMPIWGLQPHTVIVQPPATELIRPLDPGIVKHPPQGLFAEQPARPAAPQNLYPGLKILPIEVANLDSLPSLWPNAKVIPIPITWPHAKVIPIPTKTDGFAALSVHSPAEPARK